MIKILIKIKILTDDNKVVEQFEPLVIDTLAPEVSKGKGKSAFGRWTSHSRYIGRTTSGNYFLWNWHHETVGPNVSFADPVGFFLDSDDVDAPFMTLGNFLPKKMSSGFGDLLRVSMPISERRVKWSKP